MNNQIVSKINKSGFIEFLYLGFASLFRKIISVLSIFIYKLRGYDIAYSVDLGKGISFFQSKKHAINIKDGCFLGNGINIKAGFSGEIRIGKKVYIHDNSSIFSHKKLKIGDFTLISANCMITDFNHKLPHEKYVNNLKSENSYESRTVTIGKYVWVGANSVILPGVNIGDGVVIGAGSVVTKSIPENSIAVGNPARILRKITK